MGNNAQRDLKRDAALREAGFDTFRIPARDVLGNLEGVLTMISTACVNRPLHHSALPSGPPPRSGED